MGALEYIGFITPEFILRRINAINAVSTFCYIKEGRSISRSKKSGRRPITNNLPSSPTKRPWISTEDNTNIVLLKAIESIRIKSLNDRPRIYFLCVGNPKLSLKDRIIEHTTPSSLTRHFLRKHINPP
ncbi:uncharacterized protein N7498_004699 [Penicillium cinerascens]|uniref:Uncharacterized protein n=1 Tax=Penicillium cinerascens TaxID=70096 RepID=A0A9W9MM08_9EURO|nr:uncharacterized protein N7498_004699 [Penicillium cinerascens]KAJ5203820.1 hypothetical protein N7498_004699 [Penicillium cinerascens]